jgi:hypothetical protein
LRTLEASLPLARPKGAKVGEQSRVATVTSREDARKVTLALFAYSEVIP